VDFVVIRLLMKTVTAFLMMVAVRGQVFEAASIKPNNTGKPGSGMSLYPNRIKIINSTLKFCVQMGWNVKDFQVAGGAGWMDTERYDIDAVGANPFTKEESRTMLRALLADRFGLAVHSETQDRQGYVLVTARNGPKLPPPIDDPSVLFSRTPTGDRTLKATNVSMARFAEALSFPLGAIVVDRTGIEGQYDVSFQWTSDPAGDSRTLKSGEPAPAPPVDATPGPSIFTALQEKLGLRLESKKVPVEVIVIERANRPSEN
jgi:uncharacterized protein (TIGR03435 family)